MSDDTMKESARGSRDPAPDFEAWEADGGPERLGEGVPSPGSAAINPLGFVVYLALGTFLGFVFVLSEVVSWYRIQEMFRFQSFHMYGIIGSAVAVGLISVQLIKRLGIRTIGGETITFTPKEWGDSRVPGARYWIGGTFFGVGWALLGACPGPIFALIGSGVTVMVVALAAAMAGTWTYAALQPHLPH
jgi:uncharacterized protein